MSARYLLLATTEGAYGGKAGYTRLSDFIPDSTLITESRSEPVGLLTRLQSAGLSRLSSSRWYRASSLRVELRAWREVRAGFKGVIHYLWAERDWALLDRLKAWGRLPVCATFHACPDDLPGIVRFPGRLKMLDAILLMSKVQRPFFLSHGVAPERIHVIHHGVDCDFFRPAPAAGQASRPVLFVGNYRRNFSLLRDVCIGLQAFPGIKVKVVAPRDRGRFVEGLSNVEFVSGLDAEDLRGCYQGALCLLMTVDGATANNAILEAMACGLPIVSEDVGGIREYTGNHAAILCKPQSSEDLIQAILRLRENPEMTARLGAQARIRAEQLSWSAVAGTTVARYDALLGTFTTSSLPP